MVKVFSTTVKQGSGNPLNKIFNWELPTYMGGSWGGDWSLNLFHGCLP